MVDRLGSVVSSGKKYLPYGDEVPATVGDGYRFATYWRDAESGLDYADQRYYASTVGRFMTPDLSTRNWKLTTPHSWNHYIYVECDPVNANDPTGENLGRIFKGMWGLITHAGSEVTDWFGSAFGLRPSVSSTISYGGQPGAPPQSEAVSSGRPSASVPQTTSTTVISPPDAVLATISMPISTFLIGEVVLAYIPGHGTVIGAGIGAGTPGFNMGPVWAPRGMSATGALTGFGWSVQGNLTEVLGLQASGGPNNAVFGPSLGSPGGSIAVTGSVLLPQLWP